MRGQRASTTAGGARGQLDAGTRLLCPSTGSPRCTDMPCVGCSGGQGTGWNKDISLAIASLAGLLYRLTLSTGA